MTQAEILDALKQATSAQLAAELASRRKLKCSCGECATCKSREYVRKFRDKGKAGT